MGAQAFPSSLNRCRILRFVIQRNVVRSLFSSEVACCIRQYWWSKDILSRHYSSSSPSLRRYCKHEGCGLHANFGWADDGKPLYCSFHKEAEMENVKDKQCEHPGCDIRPHFGYFSKEGVRCVSHKLPGMIDVITRRCEYEGCDSISPSYNVPGSRRGRFCDKHKHENMIDVRSRRCGHEGCNAGPRFGFILARGRLLANTKLSSMKHHRHLKCAEKGCKRIARFGSVLREPLYCSEHKVDQMKDVVSNRCSEHKLVGMVDFHKKCEQKGCSKPASFGMPGSSFQYCGLHRFEGMIQYKGSVKPV